MATTRSCLVWYPVLMLSYVSQMYQKAGPSGNQSNLSSFARSRYNPLQPQTLMKITEILGLVYCILLTSLMVNSYK